jgi:hypothetical protein
MNINTTSGVNGIPDLQQFFAQGATIKYMFVEIVPPKQTNAVIIEDQPQGTATELPPSSTLPQPTAVVPAPRIINRPVPVISPTLEAQETGPAIGPSRQENETQEKYSNKSCLNCRQSHSRCDKKSPVCTVCDEKSLFCTYPDTVQSTPRRTSERQRITPVETRSRTPRADRVCFLCEGTHKVYYLIPSEPELSRLKQFISQRSPNSVVDRNIHSKVPTSDSYHCESCYRQYLIKIRAGSKKRKNNDSDQEDLEYESPKKRATRP